MFFFGREVSRPTDSALALTCLSLSLCLSLPPAQGVFVRFAPQRAKTASRALERRLVSSLSLSLRDGLGRMKKRQEKLESSSNVTDGEPGTRLGPLEYDCDFEEKRIIKCSSM